MSGILVTPDERNAARDEIVPFLPTDPNAIPEVRYQVLAGRVYVLTVWKDGSTARGETDLDSLARRRGAPVTQEGWYDVFGRYLGADAKL